MYQYLLFKQQSKVLEKLRKSYKNCNIKFALKTCNNCRTTRKHLQNMKNNKKIFYDKTHKRIKSQRKLLESKKNFRMCGESSS